MEFLPTHASFLLADFVTLRKKSRNLEIGTGAGFVKMELAGRFPDSSCFGIDLCFDALSAAEQDKVPRMVVCADARKKAIPFKNNSFDAVICNPPFYDCKNYRPAPEAQRALARMELTMSFSQLTETVRYLLKDKGSFFFIHNTSRIAEIVIELYKNNLWVKELQFVVTKKYAPMKLVLVHARLNSSGETTVLPCKNIINE